MRVGKIVTASEAPQTMLATQEAVTEIVGLLSTETSTLRSFPPDYNVRLPFVLRLLSSIVPQILYKEVNDPPAEAAWPVRQIW
jgi:hypothetical protein